MIEFGATSRQAVIHKRVFQDLVSSDCLSPLTECVCGTTGLWHAADLRFASAGSFAHNGSVAQRASSTRSQALAIFQSRITLWGEIITEIMLPPVLRLCGTNTGIGFTSNIHAEGVRGC